jgi:GT2 family glycosyltransferase
MDLHVLTLNWNGEKYLPGLYSGFINLTNNYNKIVWHIRDNGSKDKSIQIISKFKDVDLMEAGHNRDSFAVGMNSLFDRINPNNNDHILLLNNDVQLPNKDMIIKMRNLMESVNSGVVGTRLLYIGTDKLQHAGVIFGDRYGKLPYHYRYGEKNDNESEKNRYFQAVTAAVCLIKASSFRSVGKFDPGFLWAFDDIDLILRIGQKEKVAYCGETYAYHEESVSLKKNPMNKLFMEKNVSYFKSKWAGKYKLDHELYLKNPKYNAI